jgi:hypothetical protein
MAEGIGAVVALLIGVTIYFIPAMVGQHRHHARAIFVLNVLNILLRWTIIGWVGALIWAMTAETADSGQTQFIRRVCADPDKKCPDCAELVKADARKCRFCGYLFGA